MTIAIFFIPFITAIANRLWRGEGALPKGLWFVFMAALALGCDEDIWFGTIDIGLIIGWLLFLVGYAVPPTHAMFSAVHGRAPGRKDGWLYQWAQEGAERINDFIWGHSIPEPVRYWQLFGVIHGALRALWMLPGVCMLYGYTGSPFALAGLLSVSLGAWYYAGGALSRHFGRGEELGVPFAEIGFGWWIGSYMLLMGVMA